VTSDQSGTIWLMLHSGSRQIGKVIAERHIDIARQLEHNQLLPDRDLAVFLAVGCEFGGEEAAVVGGWFPAEVVADGEGLLERHGPGVVRPGPKPGHGLLNRQNEEVSHGTVLSLGCLMSG